MYPPIPGRIVVPLLAACCCSGSLIASVLPAPTVTAQATAFPSSWPGSNAVDQSTNEYLSNYAGNATYLEFDFGTARTVDGFVNVTTGDIQRRTETQRLIFDTDGTAGFNAATDTVVTFSAAQTGAQGQGYVNRFPAVAASKVRWEVLTSSGTDARLGTTEMAFLSTAAGSAPITGVTVIGSATPFSSQYAAAYAANGIAGVGYVAGVEYASAGAGANMYVDFDLGVSKPVTGFDFFDRLGISDRTNSFDLIFSNNADMSSPVAVKSYNKSTSWTASDSFAAVTARYVRLDCTAAGAGANTGVGELQFYGPSVNQAPSFNLPAAVVNPPGGTWTEQAGCPALNWIATAASGDGSKIVAAAYDNQIYTSADSGVTWTKRRFQPDGVPANIELGQVWTSVAISADGSLIFATTKGGYLLSSSDLGATWVVRDKTTSPSGWASVACSADGTKVVGVRAFGTVFTSTNSGQTFTPRLTDQNRLWGDIASSADGTKLVAVENDSTGASLWTSTDSGVTWTARTSAGVRPWQSVASSADGSKLIAVVYGGKVYTSVDSGATWSERFSDATRWWNSCSVSADGQQQAVINDDGQLWLSADSGATWALNRTFSVREVSFNRTGAASFLSAAVLGGKVQTSTSVITPYTVAVTPGSGAVSLAGFASAISAGTGESSQTVSFTVTNTNNALFSTQPAIAPDGTLTFKPGMTTGSATVTVVARDNGGTANGGVDTSAAKTFVISIPVDSAGTWSTAAWLNDATSGIVPGQTVWAARFGSTGAATINGTAATGINSFPYTSASFDFAGPNQLYTGDSNDLTAGSGGSAVVGQTFAWNGYDNTMTLKGLTPGQAYVLSILSVGWEAETGVRRANFGSGSDVLTVDQNQFGLKKGIRIDYVFTASATTRTIKVNSISPNASTHFYGASLRLGGASNNQAPTDISLTNATLNENNTPGTTIGNFSAADPDAGQTQIFELVSGAGSADNAAFTIDASGNLKINGSADYETKNSYSVRVRATDNGFPAQSFEKVFTISIVNVNEAATDITLSNAAVQEHNATYTDVGTFAAIGDPDSSNFTWALVSGTGDADNASFRTYLNTSLLQILVSSDRQVKTSYSIRVRVTDNGFPAQSFEKAFTIQIVDVNDPPVVSTPANQTILEDQSTSAVSFTISDPETAASGLVLTGTSSNTTLVPNSAIVFGGSAGNRTVTVTPAANRSGTSTITVSVSDGVMSTVRSFTLMVTPVNDAPSFTLAAGSPYTVKGYANQATTNVPGVVTASSAGPEESSQALSFAVTNTNNAMFIGQPSIDASGTLNFTPSGTGGTATVSVRAVDNGGTSNGGVDTSAAQTFVITLQVAVPATDIVLSSSSVTENNAVGAVIGTLSAVDSNSGETHAFSLVSGTGSNDNGSFAVSGNSLILNAQANYEAKSSYSIRLRATDTGIPAKTFDKVFTVTVIDINEAPTDIAASALKLPENSGPGKVIGTLSSVDADAGQTVTYSLVTGSGSTDNGAFVIDGNTLKALNDADYETTKSYSIRVRATDSGSPAQFFEKTLTVTVTDVNEPPTDITLPQTSFEEVRATDFQTKHAYLGSLSAADPDAGQTFTFSIPPSNGLDDNLKFQVVNGKMLYLNDTPDYEQRKVWKVRVRVTDSGTPAKSFIKELTINITNFDDPTYMDHLVASQRPGSKKVDITYSLRDPDVGTTVPVSFQISSNGGTTWSLPITGSTGAFGAAVPTESVDESALAPTSYEWVYTMRTITWDGALNWNEQTSSQMKVRVTAAGIVRDSDLFTVDTRGDGNLTIIGRAISRSTSLPLSGVTMKIGTRTATTGADGKFQFNNAAPGTLTAQLAQYLTVTQAVAVQSGQLSMNIGDIQLRPDTTDPVVESVSPDVKGMIISKFNVTTPLRIKVGWGTGTPGQVIIKLKPTPSSTPVVFATLTSSTNGTDYVSPALSIDANFPASFDPNNNKVIVEAVNSLGVRSALETIRMSVVPLPSQLAALATDDGYQQFPSPVVAGKPTPPLNHLGFDYGTVDEGMSVTVPELGKWGFSFGAGGAFDYTMSDGNWENAFVVGDLGLFGGQFRNAKQFSRPGNAFDVDGDRPTLELYLGDKTISGSIVARDFGSTSSTSGMKPGSMQAALAIHFDDKIGEIYTLDIIPPLRGMPKVVKKIFGNIALYGTIGLDGSGTIAIDPQPRLIDGTVGGTVGLRAALELDFKLVEASVWVGGIANVRLGQPNPILREAGIRFYAGYSIDSFFYDKSGQVTIGEWRYTAPVSAASILSNANLGSVPWQPMPRPWRELGEESFLQTPANGGGRTTLGSGGSGNSRLSSELNLFNRLGSPQTLTIPSDASLPAQAALPLLDNVFPKSKPSLAERNGKLMLAYVRDTGAANPVQFTEIAYTYYNGTTWTTPAAIHADPRAQLQPKVMFDGNGDAIAVWAQVKDPNFAVTDDPSAMAAQLEIVAARWNAATGLWGNPVTLTDNAVLDNQLVLGGPLANGDLMLGWVRNAANETSGSGAAGAATNDQLVTARWAVATGTWSAPQVVYSSVTNNLGVSFAAAGNKAAFVWTQDQDGNFDTSGDGELYALQWNGSAWGSATRVTNDAIDDRSPQVAISSGSVRTLWVHGTDLVMQSDFTGPLSVVRGNATSSAFSDCTLTANSAGQILALWQEMSATGPDVFYRVYDPVSATWGQDDQLSHDSMLEKSFSPVWDSAGNLVIAYCNVEMVETTQTVTLSDGTVDQIEGVPTPGRNDLFVARRRIIKDLGMVTDSVKIEGTSYLPGASTTLKATVKNTGNLAVQAPKVSFYLGDPASGGTLIGSQTLTGWLRGAEETVVSQAWTIPSTLTATTKLFAMVDPDSSVTEFDEGNNKASMEFGGYDLSLQYQGGTVLRGGSVRVTARISNEGSSTSPVSSLKLWDCIGDGHQRASATVGSLQAGQSMDMVLDLPAGAQAEGDTDYRLALNEETVGGELRGNNNDSEFTLTFFIDDDQDGMPAGWEAANGLSDSNANDATADFDRDGFTNRDEYLAGTDPRNASSFLRIGQFNVKKVAGSQGRISTISWPTVAGRSYVVERSTNLTTWTEVKSGIAATPPLNTLTDEVGDANRTFYRVRPQ